jgi:hypothetical protein
MDLACSRADIEQRRRQIDRQRKDILDLQRAGISTKSAEELLARMLAKVDELCVEHDRLDERFHETDHIGRRDTIPCEWAFSAAILAPGQLWNMIRTTGTLN